jgi:hypothetical protein
VLLLLLPLLLLLLLLLLMAGRLGRLWASLRSPWSRLLCAQRGCQLPR